MGLLAVAFVVVPLIEIYLVIKASQMIGVGWTILILVFDSLLGAWLLKHQGAAAWRALREAIAAYRMPARELADGVIVLIGGTLLLTPGFFTDALGFLLLLPVTRPVARKALTAYIARKFLDGTATVSAGRGARTRQRPGPDDVVQGEVID